MSNWKPMHGPTMDKVWDWFYKEFEFRPSVYPQDWPSIHPQVHHFKLDISAIFEDYPSEAQLEAFEDLCKVIFLRLTRPGDLLYALDWQHDCFEFNPRMGWTESESRYISIFPDGDYHIFLTSDLGNLWFGHPWEQSVTLVGEGIARLAERMLPEFESLGVKAFRSRGK